MKLRSAIGAAALAAGSMFSVPAAAVPCTESFNLGSMGPPDIAALGNDFRSAQHFNDCYNFTLNSATDAFGLAGEWDLSLTRGIDITSVSLSGGSLSGVLTDFTPETFSFSDLLAGAYRLVISGDVTNTDWSWLDPFKVGYSGTVATVPSHGQVPEPDTFALLALGLAVAGWTAKRRSAARRDETA